MKTRSETNYDNNALYTVNIDFDGASEEWRSNKFNMGNGVYRYICAKRGITGNLCIKKCKAGEEYCCVHLKMIKKQKLNQKKEYKF
jgi:hypothetical protein